MLMVHEFHSRTRRSLRRSGRWVLAALLVVSTVPADRADTVVRRDGTEMGGDVISLDRDKLVLLVGDKRVSVAREEVAVIRLSRDKPPPPLRVEIRNIASDDSVDVLLDDRPVILEARTGGEWVNLTPKLKDGNNPIRLRIHNRRGNWAYKIGVRINGESTVLSCGKAFDLSRPCTCCGKTGMETGVFDLPIIWLHVDRAAGRAEILP